jgi:hypothetical protein
MDLKGGVGPDRDSEFSRLDPIGAKCELIWSLVEIRVTNAASLQIADIAIRVFSR